MRTFRFVDFPVYQDAKVLYKEIVVITKDLRDWSMRDQIRRATLSIALNIAEGSAKESDRDFGRFLQTALGSVNETYSCLDIMCDNGWITHENFQILGARCKEIAKQLGGLLKAVRRASPYGR